MRVDVRADDGVRLGAHTASLSGPRPPRSARPPEEPPSAPYGSARRARRPGRPCGSRLVAPPRGRRRCRRPRGGGRRGSCPSARSDGPVGARVGGPVAVPRCIRRGPGSGPDARADVADAPAGGSRRGAPPRGSAESDGAADAHPAQGRRAAHARLREATDLPGGRPGGRTEAHPARTRDGSRRASGREGRPGGRVTPRAA
ncbi:hypothetical protein SCATT_40340 [Streptantibioticus cattleyicolor NRRL 8057 = DSM 46488]|uniref:Uncharacterized protein n=1 Tax=Streptantibioticus cattleyicolor (strain ATCC 35852 / DSM 46488 / JCM 4925 / NBRC 14057 / NRRL 8057) TaxID=1003195 RepID=G8WX94_STREN|nr:hypothetical protein SCATT_40340 [Streptantibioticus cattleyicolor NRRL 8057 = DSM 46488]